MQRVPLLASVGLLVMSACGPETPTRTWGPDDHAHAAPRANQVTPAREARTQGESPERARARAIAALYRVSCATCHGAEGGGDGPAAPGALPDFRSAAWQEGIRDEQIAEVIRLGRPPMPAFGDQIQGANLRALVAYIRSFSEVAEEPRE